MADVGAARGPRVTTRSRPWPSADGRVGSVASVRSMAWLETRRFWRQSENRLAQSWRRVSRRLRLGSRRPPLVRFRSQRRPTRGRPAQPIVVEVVCERRAQTAAEQACCLAAQELRPAGADPPRRRPQTRAAQHVCDRRRRDADPESIQLSLDADVAPPGVLACQPLNQAPGLGGKRWAAGPAAARSSLSQEQRAVPTQKCLRADRKARSALRRKQPAGRSEQGSIDGRVPRPLPATPEDRELVA